jgi:DNA ligase-1
MTQSLRPLLAASISSALDLKKLNYPLIVSPKLDGVRCMIHPTLGAVSRSFKPLPNEYLQSQMKVPDAWYLDGELIVGDATAHNVFNTTQSGVMTGSGAPIFTYLVFDDWSFDDKPYSERLELAKVKVTKLQTEHGMGFVVHHEYGWAQTESDVIAFEEAYLAKGYEGIMLRATYGKYKYGRSTLREQILLKWKRVEDAEAVVIGFAPLERNQNPQDRDAFGLAKRSSHAAGRVADELLGALLVEHPTFGTFSIGSGFDVALRQEVWANQSRYLGKVVTFKFQPVGVKEKPRFPIFKGFRED